MRKIKKLLMTFGIAGALAIGVGASAATINNSKPIKANAEVDESFTIRIDTGILQSSSYEDGSKALGVGDKKINVSYTQCMKGSFKQSHFLQLKKKNFIKTTDCIKEYYIKSISISTFYGNDSSKSGNFNVSASANEAFEEDEIVYTGANDFAKTWTVQDSIKFICIDTNTNKTGMFNSIDITYDKQVSGGGSTTPDTPTLSANGIAFAKKITNNVTCDPTGAKAPSKEQWNALVTEYAGISADDKEYLKTATHDDANVGDAMAKYDYIVSKYTANVYEDFLGRNPQPQEVNVTMFENDIAIISIVVISVLSISTIAIFAISKRRKATR